MPNYLVTGGLGFIGSHLVSALVERRDARVTVVDNLLNQVLPVDEVVRQIKGDRPGKLRVEIASIADFYPRHSFDVIFHLASVVGPAAVLRHAGHITEAVVRDTYAAMRLAQDHAAVLVNVSTSEVYGGGDRGYCREDTPRVIRGAPSARQEYASAKLACEVALANLSCSEELRAVTVRPFNVAGTRQLGRAGFVLPRFVGQAMLGMPLTVFGDGTQIRAFTDVRDMAWGILIVGERGKPGQAYNVGNPRNRITIRELAERVLQVTGSESPIEFVDPKSIYGPLYAEAADKFPNVEQVTQLGWQPCRTLSETIRSVHKSFAKMPQHLVAEMAGIDVPGPVGTPCCTQVNSSRALA